MEWLLHLGQIKEPLLWMPEFVGRETENFMGLREGVNVNVTYCELYGDVTYNCYLHFVWKLCNLSLPRWFSLLCVSVIVNAVLRRC